MPHPIPFPRRGARAAAAAAVVAALLLSGCALTPVNYEGTDSGRYSDGRVWSYSGGKFADQKDGRGVMAWSDGDRFEGEWIAYKGPQRGTMTYRDGNVYSGPVAPNYAPHGKGRKVWKDGGCSYEGDWVDGRQHGEGVYRCPNGYTRTGSYRNGKPHGRSVVVFPDGQRYEGLWSEGERIDPAAYIRFSGGNEYKGPFVADKRDGAGWFRNAAEGREYRHFYRADTLMASVPIGSALPACAAAPAGWLLVGGECGSAGLDGDVVLATPDGMRRYKATYRGGAPTGVADQVELTATQALWIKGTARAPGDFTNGQRFVAVTGGDGKGVWQHQFDGALAGTAPGRGRCLFRGQWEACEHAPDGRRVDALYVARAAAEERADEERRAAERRAEAEEREREARERRAAAERRAEQEAEDRAEARAAMHQAITGSLAGLQQNLAQLQQQDRRTAQLIAQANRERADREAQRQADARRDRERAEAERDEARRRQAAAAQRSQQVAQAQTQLAAQAQQAAVQQRQEAERREQARREQEAAAARRAQEQREAEAERKRQEEERAAQARAEAERRKAEAERKRAEEAARKQAEEAARKTALAFCWRSDKGYWNCDGRVQETLIGEKGDEGLDEQLGLVGCKQPRRLTTTGEITLTSTRGKQRTGHVYDCGYKLDAGDTGPMTWNRDIRRWWRDMPW